MSRLLKAALLVPIMVAAFVTIALSIFASDEFLERGQEGKDMLLLIAVSSLIMVQVLILVFGTPYYFWLKKHNKVTRNRIQVGGFGFGACAGLAMVILSHNDDMAIQLGQIAFYAFSGFIIAHLLWRIGLKTHSTKKQKKT